jgi:hypothetical protein
MAPPTAIITIAMVIIIRFFRTASSVTYRPGCPRVCAIIDADIIFLLKTQQE